MNHQRKNVFRVDVGVIKEQEPPEPESGPDLSLLVRAGQVLTRCKLSRRVIYQTSFAMVIFCTLITIALQYYYAFACHLFAVPLLFKPKWKGSKWSYDV